MLKNYRFTIVADGGYGCWRTRQRRTSVSKEEIWYEEQQNFPPSIHQPPNRAVKERDGWRKQRSHSQTTTKPHHIVKGMLHDSTTHSTKSKIKSIGARVRFLKKASNILTQNPWMLSKTQCKHFCSPHFWFFSWFESQSSPS